MQEPTKRILTDDLHNANIASSQPPSSTPDDLLQRLRNAGPRVRKSVTEGYRTTPSSFSKAQSTGSIFQSMNDTMRDVYANSPDPGLRCNTTRKRTRSSSEIMAETIPEAYDISIDPPSSSATCPPPDTAGITTPRKVKSLRAPSRALLETRSLPVGAFAFAGSTQSSSFIPTTDIADEDDWSYGNSFQTSQPAFEPMTLDSD
ncbi:hypothetical protein BJ912DRAFT_864654 [Pholiota molesta]|nr:hypothetical protein BJ912DRAFT_864654 [Pholiota molesta]